MVKPRQFRACAEHRVAIVSLDAKNWTAKQIADFVKRDVRTVKRILQRAKAKTAKKAPKNTPHKRQVKARLRKVAALATETVTKNGKTRPKYATAGAIAKELNRQGFSVSRWTIRRDLIAEGFVLRVRQTIPTTQASDKQKRKTFTAAARSWDWEHLVFDDEKVFTVNDCGHRTMWVRRGQQPLGRETRRFAVRVLVWAAIAKDTLVYYIVPNLTDVQVSHERRVAYAKSRGQARPNPPTPQQIANSPADEHRIGSVTSENYTGDCLQKLLPYFRADRRHRFIQDGAKAHTSKHTREWMEKRKVNFITNWPPRSPDLNPIETLWAHVARKVSDLFPQTHMELCSAIHQAMHDMHANHMGTINNLCRSFPERAKQVHKHRGEYRW